MRKLNMVKIFSLLLIIVLFISLFSTIGTTTYHAFFADDTFDQGTMIGPIDVSGLTDEEAKTSLLTEIETWYDLGEISIVSGEETFVLEKRQVYSFEILNSVTSAKNGEQNPLLANIKDEEYSHVVNEFKKTGQHEIETNKLKSEMLQPAQTLLLGEVAINLAQFIQVDERTIISEAIINSPSDESGLLKWVKEFGIVAIPANTPLSISSLLTENDVLNKYSNETLSVIATGIYSTVLSTNFDIVERHISDKLPPYATFGHEAMIEKEKKDLIIYNKNPYEYKFVFSLTEKGLQVQLTGAQLPQDISVVVKDEESFEPKVIKQFDSKLKKGRSVVKQKGEQGKVGKIYRIVKERGQLDKHVLVAQDYYPPIPVIDVQSILVPDVKQQNTPTDQGPNTSDPESNPYLPNDLPEDDQEEKHSDNSNIDLWENPNPQYPRKE